MTGYLWCLGECWACHRPMQFNPDLVPSLEVDGVREPICERCVRRANPMRAERGLPPIEVLPGAYEPQEVS